MRFLIAVTVSCLALPAVAQIKHPASECIDIAVFHGNGAKTAEELATIRQSDNLKEVLLSLKYQAALCLEREVMANPELAAFTKKNLPFDVKIKGTESGKLEATCECEKYIETSKSLGEAKYRLAAGKCYSSVISRHKMPAAKKLPLDKTFCWDGVSVHKTVPVATPAPSGGVK